jgi:hypothetical protein
MDLIFLFIPKKKVDGISWKEEKHKIVATLFEDQKTKQFEPKKELTFSVLEESGEKFALLFFKLQTILLYLLGVQRKERQKGS